MTLNQAIERLDRLQRNSYPTALKIEWLSKLDEQIFNDVISAYEHETEPSFTPYTVDTAGDTLLVVGSPHDSDLYQCYLQLCVDRENGDTAKYNQDTVLYNAVYNRYWGCYNSSHTKKNASTNRFRY